MYGNAKEFRMAKTNNAKEQIRKTYTFWIQILLQSYNNQDCDTDVMIDMHLYGIKLRV